MPTRVPVRLPAAAPSRAAVTTSGRADVNEVESRGSCTAMVACSSAVSSTVRANGPAWSSEDENAISP